MEVIFSCEEAALEVQMILCLSVCQSVRKTEFNCSVSAIFLSVPVHSLSCVMFRQCDIPVCPCTFLIMFNFLSV